MKKPFFLILALGVFGTGCVSENKPSKMESGGLDMIVMHRTRDLRLLFRSEQEIKNLEKAAVCSIEKCRAISKRQKITVGSGLSLDEVVHLLFGHAYDGQIKVISENSIVQTSQADFYSSDQSNILVRPGDLIFIGARD